MRLLNLTLKELIRSEEGIVPFLLHGNAEPYLKGIDTRIFNSDSNTPTIYMFSSVAGYHKRRVFYTIPCYRLC